MTEPSWTTDELDRIGNADELPIAPRGKDGTLRRAVPIWVVRVGDELYVPSWRGDGGRWYRAARTSGEAHISAGSAARAHFTRARRAHRTARARRALTARGPSRTQPRDLADTAALAWRSGHLRTIPLDSIVGTVDPTPDFDADFRPATDRVASRWESIARAHHEGHWLPPIDVIERADGYYVLDGRHRVSVARALDRHDIDAWTRPAGLVPRARPAEPPNNQDAAMPNPACRCARARRSATSTAAHPIGSRGTGH